MICMNFGHIVFDSFLYTLIFAFLAFFTYEYSRWSKSIAKRVLIIFASGIIWWLLLLIWILFKG